LAHRINHEGQKTTNLTVFSNSAFCCGDT